MSVLLVHRDTEFAKAAAYRVGEVGGVKEDGYAKAVAPCYLVVRVADLSVEDARTLYCESGAPKDLVVQDTAERRRFEALRAEQAKRFEYRNRQAMQRERFTMKVQGAPVGSNDPPTFRKNGKLTLTKAEVLRRSDRRERAAAAANEIGARRVMSDWHRERDRSQNRFHRDLAKSSREAWIEAGARDESKLVDYEKHPRRKRRLELPQLPAPDASGEVHVDAAGLAAVTIEATS